MYKLIADGKVKVVEIIYWRGIVLIPDFEKRYKDYVLIISKASLDKKNDEYMLNDIASLVNTEEVSKMIEYYKDKVKRIAVRYKENRIVRFVDNGEIEVYENIIKGIATA